MAHKRSQTAQNATSSIADDLTVIKGIGSIIVSRLRNRGIFTYAQLAELTADTISAMAIGVPAKRIAKENWIKQAQKLASRTETVAPVKSSAARESHQHYAMFMIELLIGADNRVRRTRITNIQTKLKASWAGWADRQLLSFITKCADLSAPIPESGIDPSFLSDNESNLLPETFTPPVQTSRVIPSKQPVISKPKSVISGALQVSELVTTPLDSITHRHVVHAGEMFNVRILLDLTNLDISTPLECIVTIWAKQLGTGVRQIVGEQQTTFMPAEKIPCIIESKIPSQGTYRLEAMAALTPVSTFLSTRSTLRAWREGGILQVY